MDATNASPIQTAVELQGAMLRKHDTELAAARHAVDSLAAQLSDLSAQVHRLKRGPPVFSGGLESPEPRVNNPPCYAGEPTQCWSFLTQCELVFSLQPVTYARERARVANVISLLTGHAHEWGTAA